MGGDTQMVGADQILHVVDRSQIGLQGVTPPEQWPNPDDAGFWAIAIMSLYSVYGPEESLRMVPRSPRIAKTPTSRPPVRMLSGTSGSNSGNFPPLLRLGWQ